MKNKSREVEEMDENKNIDPVKAEIVEGKKKYTVGGIVKDIIGFLCCAWLILYLMMRCASPDSDETAASTASNTKAPKQETQAEEFRETDVLPAKELDDTVIDAILLGNPNYDKYNHVGRKYKLVNGGSMEYLDAGYGFGLIYVLVEVTSSEDDPLYYSQDDATLYVDDYEVPIGGLEKLAIDNGYVFIDGNTSYPTEITVNAGGRKGKIVFVSEIPDNISNDSDIEFEIAGGIFKVNPASVVHIDDKTEALWESDEPEVDKGRDSLGLYFGTYECDHNDIYGWNQAFIGFNTDEEDGYYIMIDCHDAEDTGMPDNFGGSIEKAGEMDENGMVPYIIKDYNGTEVFRLNAIMYRGFLLEVIDPDYREGISSFEGHYILKEELNLDEVS